MPLRAGKRFTDRTPTISRPRTAATSPAAASLGQGRCPPARIAEDGTRWCAYSDHTLNPKRRTRRCPACAKYRDRIRHTPLGRTFRQLPTEVLQGLVAHAHHGERIVAQVNGQLGTHQDPTRDDLLALIAAAKILNDITFILEEFLHPLARSA